MVISGMAERLSKMQAFLLLRYTLIAATAYLLLVEDRFVIPPLGVSLLIAAALASNVLAGWLPSRILDSMAFAAAVIVGDTMWVTAALLHSGHFGSDFFYLYFFVLLLAATGESLGLIALGAAVVCIAYVYVLSATGATWSLWNSPSIIRIPFLFTVAAFYGYLIERVRREEKRVAKVQEAMCARQEFLTTVTHEIRTPMHCLLGWTDLLLDTHLNAEQRDLAERLRRSGRSLLAIIGDVLDASKIDAGKLELESVAFDIREVVEDVTEQLAESAQRKGLHLASHVHSRLPTTLRGDAIRVRQTLTNLIGNAVKFTARGEVIVRATLADQNDASVLVRFEVADSGIGIPAEAQERIFEPFSQVESATTRTYGGTGLGLAIAKQLAELMGGEIGVTSEPGHGSTFWFTVRLARDGACADEPGPSLVLSGRRALVVDGRESTRAILCEQLRDWGMQADVVADAGAALERLRAAVRANAPYELAVVDVQIGRMSGLELAHAIRTEPALASTRIALLAPLAERDQVDTGRPPGATATITKPVRRTRLHECLVELIDGPTRDSRPLAGAQRVAVNA